MIYPQIAGHFSGDFNNASKVTFSPWTKSEFRKDVKEKECCRRCEKVFKGDPSYHGRTNFSYISFQKLTNRLQENKKLARRVTILGMKILNILTYYFNVLNCLFDYYYTFNTVITVFQFLPILENSWNTFYLNIKINMLVGAAVGSTASGCR